MARPPHGRLPTACPLTPISLTGPALKPGHEAPTFPSTAARL